MNISKMATQLLISNISFKILAIQLSHNFSILKSKKNIFENLTEYSQHS